MKIGQEHLDDEERFRSWHDTQLPDAEAPDTKSRKF
jgi:hypothetical protein